MEPGRAILLIATVVGAFVTIGGLVAAYMAARREYRDAEWRVQKMRELGDAERAEADRANEERADPANSAGSREHMPPADERHAYWTAEYERHGLVRPTYDNMVYLAAFESRRLLGMVLGSTRRDFLIAAVGLIVSTVASAGSLFLAS